MTNRIALLAAFLALPACDAAKSEVQAASAAATASVAPAGDAKAKAKEAPKLAPIELAEFDLGPADPEWVGWKAQGDKQGRVMVDGVHGARIASDGRDGFDLKFSPKHTDLAQLQESLKIGEQNSKGQMKLSFDTNTKDALEWTSVGYGTTTHSFVHLMEVDGRKVSCGNNYMVGIRDTERLQQHKDACKTLKKG